MCRHLLHLCGRSHLLHGLATLMLADACVSASEPLPDQTTSQDAGAVRTGGADQRAVSGPQIDGANVPSGACPAGQCSFNAQRVDETRGCLGDREPVGCWPAGTSCPPQIVFGRDAQGARWSFPSGCLPQGFTRIEGEEQVQISLLQSCRPPVSPVQPCEALSSETCASQSDGRCKVAIGIQYDPARRCRWPGMVQLACVDFKNGCSTAITHASYADERVPSFQFPDSCVPPKYVPRPGGELVDDWEICPEAQK